MGYTIYVCDTETTGLDPEKNDVIEVCFWRVGDDESKTWCIKPINLDAIDDGALQVNKHKREDIIHKTAEGRGKYRLAEDVLPEIEMWIMEDGAAAEDRVFVGQNPEFDFKFLSSLWKKTGNDKNFPFGYWTENGGSRNKAFLVDTITIARFIDLLTGKKRQRYNLGSLVKDFGITKSQAHRADGDVKMTKELFYKMIEPFKDVAINNFSDCYNK